MNGGAIERGVVPPRGAPLRAAARVTALGLLSLCAALPLAAAVVVESVAKGSGAEKAGLSAGDRLRSYRRGRLSGRFDSPFDVARVEWGESPLGDVRIELERNGSTVRAVVAPGSWGLEVRPDFAPGDLPLFLASKSASSGEAHRLLTELAAGARDAATFAWLELRIAATMASAKRPEDQARAESLALRAAERDDRLAAEVWEAIGRVRGGDLPAAAAAFCAATTLRERISPESPALAASLDSLAETHRLRGELAEAGALYARALALLERVAPRAAEKTVALNGLGIVARRSGDFDGADRWYGRALALLEEIAPESLRVAATRNNLGNVARLRGDFAAAESHHRAALALRSKLAPGSLDEATSLMNLGLVLWNLGDLPEATDLTRRATVIQGRTAPGSISEAGGLINLANVVSDRGDLGAAESLYRRALAILEQKAPAGDEVGLCLLNLGRLLDERGEIDASEEALLRALAIQEKRVPDTVEIAATLNNLGVIRVAREDSAGAEAAFRRALAIRERLSPGSPAVASSLQNLADLARRRGDAAGAESLLRTAITHRERSATSGLELATALAQLGDLRSETGDPDGAEPFHRRAVELRESLAPDSLAVAKSRHSLAVVALARGQEAHARDELCEALRALEAQRGRLGGTEDSRAGFAAVYAGWYREYVDLLVRLGDPEEAFGTIERSRARALLALLAERHVDVAADAPPELVAERRRAEAQFESLRKRRAEASEGVSALEAEMRGATRRLSELDRRIREASPRLAALERPEPLTLEEVRERLEPGILLLSYSLGKDRGWLFTVTREAFEVFPIAAGTEEISRAVARFRAEILADGNRRGGSASARRLSDRLLRPAAEAIAAAERLVVVPDGALHVLPFAALPFGAPGTRDPGAGRDPVPVTAGAPDAAEPRLLVEALPISIVSSATVRAELARGRSGHRELRYAAFGDPHDAGGASRALLRGGAELPPLPAARREVEALTRLAGQRTTAFFGTEATEQRALAVGLEAGAIHFACHALADDRFPMESSLVLAAPAIPADPLAPDPAGNGLLEAWEVFERMRIDADVVTLSACETAAGGEVDGEGLVGLVRAFQYAGARSVLASLWSVADDSTAELMTGFYAAVEAGRPKDEALRTAQLALLRSGGPMAAPFHWAAFELFGAPR